MITETMANNSPSLVSAFGAAPICRPKTSAAIAQPMSSAMSCRQTVRWNARDLWRSASIVRTSGSGFDCFHSAKTGYLALRALPPGISPVIVTLDSALRKRVIDGVSADLTQFYVHSAVALQMAAALRAHQRAAAYRDLSDGYLLAERLTSDLRAVSHDRHLQVTFTPFKIPPPARPTAQQLARFRNQVERSNCAFEKVEILPDDIGYVKFNAFMSPAICAGTVEAAMAFVAHTRALIFELRDNGGRQPAMIAFIASYLFNRPTHLNDIYNRHQNTTTEFWTLPSLPGKRLSRQPVFVLTSHRTFSGAEEFCYDLKSLRRATIVGETTGGGAHPVNGYIVADYFQVVVPISEAINPITRTNWEGTGVLPDVKVPTADALKVAEQLATKDIQAAPAKRRPTDAQKPPRTTPSPGTERAVRRLIEGEGLSGCGGPRRHHRLGVRQGDRRSRPPCDSRAARQRRARRCRLWPGGPAALRVARTLRYRNSTGHMVVSPLPVKFALSAPQHARPKSM